MTLRIGILAAVSCLLLAAPAQAKQTLPPTQRALQSMQQRGSITPAQYRLYIGWYRQALHPNRRLPAWQRTILRQQAANSDSIASSKGLQYHLRPVMTTLHINTQQLTHPTTQPASGTRRVFGDILDDGTRSQIIWQWYLGQGWQIQPLANWGEMHRLLGLRSQLPNAQRLADELLGMMALRHGHLAIHYYFPWAGSPPGWISAMPTASAIKALGRLTIKTGDPRYQQQSQRLSYLLGVDAPVGMNQRGGAGLLLYSQLPTTLVGNAYASALLSLTDYLKDYPDEQQTADIYRRALTQATAMMGRYNTGYWSLYEINGSGNNPNRYRSGPESDMGYHQLFTDFLAGLCNRTDEPIFCRLRAAFTADISQPVQIQRWTTTVGKTQVVVALQLTKRGTVVVSSWNNNHLQRIVRQAAHRGSNIVRLPRQATTRIKVETITLSGKQTVYQRDIRITPAAKQH